jgi:hypothetical protein
MRGIGEEMALDKVKTMTDLMEIVNKSYDKYIQEKYEKVKCHCDNGSLGGWFCGNCMGKGYTLVKKK